MWNFPVLFVVFVFTGSNAINSDEEKKWIAGSTVNVTFGPVDALYCKLIDNHSRLVYDGFGPCRVIVKRVTKDHVGFWKLWIGAPGTVVARTRQVYVDVVAAAVDTTPRVTGNVTRKDSTVILKCRVPEENEIMSCMFSNPSGSVFIVTRGIDQEDQAAVSNYEFYIDRYHCTVALLKPHYEHSGIWRCSVNTTHGISHAFLVISMPMLHQDSPDNRDVEKPVLRNILSFNSDMDGDAKTLSCSIDAAVRYCYFRAPNGTVYNVGPSTSSPGYQYVGKGFDAGDCGIRFDRFWASDKGLWSCNVGLEGNYGEQSDSIFVSINQRFVAKHRWSGSSVVVSLSIFNEPKLEYCRYVRSDGLGFTSERAPNLYVPERSEDYGVCSLTIPNPTDVDLRPWMIAAKIIGEDGEVSVKTTFDSRRQPSSGTSSPIAILLWSFFGAILVFLIAVSCLPKRNREWTLHRAARIRNSFRRQPQPQQQNVTDLSPKIL